MKKLIFIFQDQLSFSIASLQALLPTEGIILFCESYQELRKIKHHQKKIAFFLASMRHFAEDLKNKGFKVHYLYLEDPKNSGVFESEIQRAIECYKIDQFIFTEPSEWDLLERTQRWPDLFSCQVTSLEDDRFLCTKATFKAWASQRKQLRMEYFYREMRKKYRILVDTQKNPVGGQWNYDHENRKKPPKQVFIPKRIAHQKSDILKKVLALVATAFSDHFGTLKPFYYAVTRAQALLELEHFIEILLPYFGSYQDIMMFNEPYLYHSLLSSYLNVGLLLPLEICKTAESAYFLGKAPLNAVEGFIRQILGWREYIRGIYWLSMPSYRALNYFEATRALPNFYWGGQTKLFCVGEVVSHTRLHAYSHHIQRLMVTGNFALLAGLDVLQVHEWYLAVYSDAFEWVELPNTLGMALYGDGGLLGSKPYAASGKYIHRMSNFCERCTYDPNKIVGENACPFNALYWHFLDRNQKKLQSNQRMVYALATWNRFPDSKKTAIQQQAEIYLNQLESGTL